MNKERSNHENVRLSVELPIVKCLNCGNRFTTILHDGCDEPVLAGSNVYCPMCGAEDSGSKEITGEIMSTEKENPNDNKPERLSFESWVTTLGLSRESIPCEECEGGHNDCEECAGDGKVECDKCEEGIVDCEECDGNCSADCAECGGDGKVECDSSGSLECEDKDCEECDHGKCEGCGGRGSIECDACNGTGGQECDEPGCDGGKVPCEVHGCDNGSIECEECEGAGHAIEYCPKNSMHLEELKSLGVCLFHTEDDTCFHADLKGEYVRIVAKEDALIEDRSKEAVTDVWGLPCR